MRSFFRLVQLEVQLLKRNPLQFLGRGVSWSNNRDLNTRFNINSTDFDAASESRELKEYFPTLAAPL